jgi:cytidylate kinase
VNARSVVAIDGAAGSGKSTLARALARRLGLAYVNTGLMYRALAAAALRARVSPDDGEALLGLTGGLRCRLAGSDPAVLEVEGYSLEDLTTLEVESTVSRVARHPRVRAAMCAMQRDLASEGAVMEGRDIGSVVFPDAAVKLYLVAEHDARAERRSDERSHPEGLVGEALRRRDALDAETNPFVAPAGAEVLDTGRLDVEATLVAAEAIVAARAPWLRQGRRP